MPIETDGVALNPLGTDPASPDTGEVWYNSLLGEPRARRGASNETLLTEPSHNALDTLAHGLVEDCEVVDTRDADGCLTSRTWRAIGGGVNIRSVDNFTFDANGLTGYRVRQFNTVGSVVQTITVSKPGGVWQQVVT